MLGSKKKVSHVPVTSTITKLHMAISPMRNDQWSGKTLSSALRRSRRPRLRESSHRAVRR
jgi:hypothetical protein